MFRNALVSVSDKSGLIDFLRPMVRAGLRVVSTGGTYQYLKENGFSVIDISEQTGFPEVMGGRVKTLHPKVHMGLLSRLDHPEDDKILSDYKVEAFDLLICNLYPFEKSVEAGVNGQALIEKIDIGGPSMLRGAAKNFSRVAVVCDPQDYQWISKKIEIGVDLDINDRKSLAARVFAHTAAYDSLVAQELGAGWGLEFSIGGHDSGVELRYGENPQQQAKWYRNLADTIGLHTAEVLQGKPLSYNNILDLEAAAGLARELVGPSAVAVKHNNPCGVASRGTLVEALKFAIEADPVSVFGGIIAVNEKLGAAEAECLADLFLECIVAPEFSAEALQIFAKKKNLRLLQWPSILKQPKSFEIRGVSGGFLVQSSDQRSSSIGQWKFLGEQPNKEVFADLVLAEKVSASLKSNSIALVKSGQTVGLGMGQVNRVEAVQHAIDRMKTHHGNLQEVVLASDAFFPFPDSIEKAAQAGVKWILQPGGSLKDDLVIERAKQMGVQMILTGVRHFRH